MHWTWFVHAVNAWGAVVIAVGAGVLVWSIKQSGSLSGLLADAGLGAAVAAGAGAGSKGGAVVPSEPAAPKPVEPPIEGVPEIPVEGA